MENTEHLQEDLLLDEIDTYFQFIQGTTSQRFLNFLIDNVLMRLGLTYATGYLVGQILLAIAPGFLLTLASDHSKFSLYALAFSIVIIC